MPDSFWTIVALFAFYEWGKYVERRATRERTVAETPPAPSVPAVPVDDANHRIMAALQEGFYRGAYAAREAAFQQATQVWLN
jgi:hypothetical protein